MKLFNLLKGNETKNIDSSLPVYRVEWKRITEEYLTGTAFKCELATRFFTNKEEAEEFAYQLEQSHKLLETKCSANLVKIKKEKDGGLWKIK